jgi:hypothetical protein
MFPRRLRARSKTLLSVVLALLTAVLAAATQPASAADGRPYTNPIKSVKGADPWLQYHNGNYYLITTTFTGVLGIRKSPTLAGLSTAANVQVWSDTTPGRNTNIWAPEIHQYNGHWYLYYSAGQSGVACCDSQRTHVLESAGTDPMGPYTYKGSLTGSNLTPGGWLIENERYPFIAYGTDWLGFAHLIIAVAFIGPLRDPVKNIWIIEFGLIACMAIFPFAFIAGAIREIPVFWRLIDCLFGFAGGIVLLFCYRDISKLQQLTRML